MIPGSPNGLVDAGDALAQAASNLDATRTSIVRQARLVDDGWIGAAYEVAAREMATGQSQQNALVVLALDPATAQLRQQATQALTAAQLDADAAVARCLQANQEAAARIQALTSELTLLPAPATAWGPLQPCPTPSSPREAVKHDGGLLSSIGHGVLDVVGLVPVLGAPADGPTRPGTPQTGIPSMRACPPPEWSPFSAGVRQVPRSASRASRLPEPWRRRDSPGRASRTAPSCPPLTAAT